MKQLFAILLMVAFGLGLQSQAQVSISGTAIYSKSTPAIFPLKYIDILLQQNNATVFQTTTDSLGHYEFNNIPAGSYILTATSTKPWGYYAAATDELAIMQYYVGMRTFTDIQKAVADINNDHFVNCMDALMISRRFLGLISSFPSGDWYYQKIPLNYGSSPIIQVIKGACFGDVDQSGTPQ